MMYLFLLVGNPIYCRLYSQSDASLLQSQCPWVGGAQTTCLFDPGFTSELTSAITVIIFLIAFRKRLNKVGPRELNAFLFSLLNVWLCAPPGTELLLWDPGEWAHLSWGVHALPFHCPAHWQIPAQKQCLLVGCGVPYLSRGLFFHRSLKASHAWRFSTFDSGCDFLIIFRQIMVSTLAERPIWRCHVVSNSVIWSRFLQTG